SAASTSSWPSAKASPTSTTWSQPAAPTASWATTVPTAGRGTELGNPQGGIRFALPPYDWDVGGKSAAPSATSRSALIRPCLGNEILEAGEVEGAGVVRSDGEEGGRSVDAQVTAEREVLFDDRRDRRIVHLLLHGCRIEPERLGDGKRLVGRRTVLL